MKILITEKKFLVKDNDVSLAEFDKFGDVVIYDNITRDELLRVAGDFDVILTNKVIIDREVMSVAKKLRYIGIFATGYNNIDLKCASEKGITVCNAAGYSTNAVVQQIIGYILLHYTKIREYDDFVKRDGWKNADGFSPIEFSSDEVFDKTLGIIGYGSIGKALEKAALGLGMKVKVHTRTVPENTSTEFVSFDELLACSDIISVNCPLTDKTADLFNEDSFNKMKDGAFFINTSRGGTVDEDALYNALLSGKLSGAAVDVLKCEPMDKNSKLCNAPNIIITPHSSWSSVATRGRLVGVVARNLEAFINGKPQNVVN